MSEPAWIDEWKEHIPLLLGAASTFFVAIRILSIADFNSETAYGILQTGGAAAVVVGALLDLIGPISVGSFFVSIYVILSPDAKAKGDEWHAVRTFICALLGFVALFTAPIIMVVSFSILAVSLGVTRRIARKRSRKQIAEIIARGDPDEISKSKSDRQKKISRGRRRNKHVTLFGAFWVALTVGLFAVSAPPWYPPEEIVVKDAHPITAYVLSDSNNELALLDAQDRGIKYVDQSMVSSRQICNDESTRGLTYITFPDLISAQPAYGSCPP